LFVVDSFSLISGLDLRSSDGGSWPQLQAHNLFVTGQVVNQVDQANRRLHMANYHASGDWQLEKPVVMGLPSLVVEAC
jgi:hypothetical protein